MAYQGYPPASIWRVNVRDQSLKIEETPKTWEKLGGRGLLARISLDEIPPACDPLGPGNKIIFAPGLFAGHMLSSCDRISIGGKSPLTGGIKEANAGGSTALCMAYLGIKALILEGLPSQTGCSVLYLNPQGVRFDNADDLSGMGVYETADCLVARYVREGNLSATARGRIAMALIGPTGEMHLSAAGIQNVDKDGIPARIAARGGMGAVMGTKGLKAIVFDAREGVRPVIQDTNSFKAAQKVLTKALIEHQQTRVYADYGTAAMTQMTYGFGALPTRNFSSGDFEGVE
jgi:aldehyde:ferredoxin oxidoreductase